MLKLLIQMPTLRLEKAAEVRKIYQDLATNPETLFVLIGPNYVGKINAVNAQPVNNDWDILLIASDDMIPQIKGYDQRIIDDMEKYFPDTDGVLWYNDGYVGELLNTLPILGRKYYERFGYVYNPEYKSLWADNEFMEVANMLGRQIYSPIVIIKHEHPGNNPEVYYDEHYRANDKHWNHDKELYNQRKQLNFNI